MAKENGATLVGDKESGRFAHDMVRGEYCMVGQTVIVTITDKYWLVLWPVVESQLRALVQSYLFVAYASHRQSPGPGVGVLDPRIEAFLLISTHFLRG